MSLVGTIQSLFQDKERTKPIFPVTKVKAVSDDNGTGLEALLEDIHTDIDAKAPAGYGLGEQAFNAPGNDANQITKCGFFRAYVNTPTGDWWTIQQEDLYGDGIYMIQKASCYAYIHVLHAERMIINGSPYEWEWVNPKMIPGVEYRTTERWNGNVVYVKLVNCGAMPNATIKRVAFTNVWATAISLDFGGKYNGTPIGKGHPYLESWDTEGNVICMRASDDKSAITDCWAIVKHVKI